MKRRDKRILIIALIVCLACVIAVVSYVGYSAIWIMRDLKSMEARRPVLLYETDHRALLDACREISRQVAAGKLKPGMYGHRAQQTSRFPQLTLDLVPMRVDVEKDGQVNLIMSPVVMYGVVAYPENYEGTPSDSFKYGDKLWGIELIDGLWYYDEDFQKYPEHKKEVEELLKKRKAGDSSGVP